MVIKASSSRQIEALMADLASDRPVAREGAVARLTVIGGRAVERLTGLVANREAAPPSRIAALRTLEAIADPRALDVSLRAINDPETGVAQAAVGVARVFLRGPRGAKVVDRLTEVALNRQRSEPIRVAAIRALSALESSTLEPLLNALRDEPSENIRALVQPRGSSPRGLRGLEGFLRHAVERELPDDPFAIRHAIAQAAGALPLPLIHRLVEQIREREGTEAGTRRAEWVTTRAAAHIALAKRGSRLALYDLRETLESGNAPLPVEFLAALTAIGDASCLEPIVAAFVRAAAPGRARGDWWQRHLVSTFQAIVARERITRRHAVIRKIERRCKDVLEHLWKTGRAGRAGRAGKAGRAGAP